MSESYFGDRDPSIPNGDVRHAALSALAHGLSVVPPEEDGSKKPLGTWKRFQVERATLDEVHRWYGTTGKPLRTGLGIVCGAISGNLEAFEFDKQGEVYEAFKAAARAVGLGDVIDRLEAGYLERSPSGGIHWLYRCEEIAGNTKLAEYESDEINPKTGKPIPKALIETRGEGGFIVVAPSNGRVHPTGRSYELVAGGIDSIPTITPEERAELFALARSFDRMPKPEPEEPKAAGDKGERWEDALSPGDDFAAQVSWRNILTGWTSVTKRADGVELWRRPGKEAGISATIGHHGDWLYVFSTSTEFQAGRTYTKFGAYTTLNFGGDFKAAAKELSRCGYGEHKTWEKVDGNWVLVKYRNPCPKGRRIARPGEGPPTGKKSSGSPPGGSSQKSAKVEPRRPFPLTDLGNGERLVSRHGRDLHYIHPWKKWLCWDGRRWALDSTAAVRRLAKETVRSIYAEAAATVDDEMRAEVARWAKASENRSRVDALIGSAEAEPGIPILPENLDSNPWLLNCPNGTLDLKSGVLGEHLREDLITRLCPVEFDPTAECPLWLSTLRLVFAENEDIIRYWQQLCGVCLTGTVTEQILPILHGTGENGKSTLLNTLMGILGPDYAMKAPHNFLMIKRQESHPTELADLSGKRLVVAIETPEGCRINETLVKELTGSDPIRARRMREDPWQFDPTHKVLLCTNHKPVIKGTDSAIWRRIHLIPFEVKIPAEKKDRNMLAKLESEWPGILAWCVRGCVDWVRSGGLEPPKEVMEATKSYRENEDILAQFLAEECVVSPGNEGQIKTKASALYGAYRSWAERSGEFAVSQRRFGDSMTERGFRRKMDNGTWYLGVGLRPQRPESGGEAEDEEVEF